MSAGLICECQSYTERFGPGGARPDRLPNGHHRYCARVKRLECEQKGHDFPPREQFNMLCRRCGAIAPLKLPSLKGASS